MTDGERETIGAILAGLAQSVVRGNVAAFRVTWDGGELVRLEVVGSGTVPELEVSDLPIDPRMWAGDGVLS